MIKVISIFISEAKDIPLFLIPITHGTTFDTSKRKHIYYEKLTPFIRIINRHFYNIM
jgi:hypothetical protein